MNRPDARSTGATSPATDDPALIRQDIDRTRGEMEGTLEAINDRVSPQRVYTRRRNRMRQRWTSVRNAIMGNDPTSSYGQGSSHGGTGESSGEDASWRDRTPDVDARGRTDQAKRAISDTPQRVERQMRGNPLTAGMIAFGLGTLIGSALPESEVERRATRQAADRVDIEGAKERMTEYARDVQETVQERARDAAEDLKGSTRDAAQDVKGHAQQEGQRVKDDAQQSGQQLRQQS